MARHPTDPRLQLQPVSARARLWLLILTVMLPVAVICISIALTLDSDGAQRLIGGSVPFTVLVVAALTSAICWVIDRFLHRHRLTLDGHALEKSSPPSIYNGWACTNCGSIRRAWSTWANTPSSSHC